MRDISISQIECLGDVSAKGTKAKQNMFKTPILQAAKMFVKETVSTTTTSTTVAASTICTSTKVKSPKQQKQSKPPPRIPTRLLILSLGNPQEYDGTRHSVGHYVLDKICMRMRAQNTRIGRFESWVVKSETSEQPSVDIWFYRVPGYMNLSGKSVSPFYKAFMQTVGESEVVVLFDELDLDLGKVKVRKQGSSHRGHNGLRDIQKHEIGREYTGVQIGIGRYYSGDKNQPGVVANYVLSKFKIEEREKLDNDVVERVMDLIEEMKHGKYVFEKVKN